MTRRRRFHVPHRTCVGCRKVRSKREMIRVVRTPDAGVQVDPTGKRAGRGAYLCRQRGCWETALAGGGLEGALRTGLTPQERETLMAFCDALAGSVDAGEEDEA